MTEKPASVPEEVGNIGDSRKQSDIVDENREKAVKLPFLKSDTISVASCRAPTPVTTKICKSSHSLRPDSPIAMHMLPTQRWSRRSYWSNTDSLRPAGSERRISCSESRSSESPRSDWNSPRSNWNTPRRASPLHGSTLEFKTTPLEPLWETEAPSSPSAKSTSTPSRLQGDGKSSDARSEMFGFCCTCVTKTRDDEEQATISPRLCST